MDKRKNRPIRINAVAPNVHAISLAWGNAYLLTEGDEAALIDTGLVQDRPNLLDALQQVGVTPAQVRAVYLTHGHCDHAGNAAFFAEAGRACRIYAHREEAPYLSLPRRSYAPQGLRLLSRPLQSLAFLLGERLVPVARCGVDRLLEDGDSVEAPGGALKVIACPGHTPGHIAFYRESDGTLFSGDSVLNIVPNLVRPWRREELSLPLRLVTTNWEQAKQSARLVAKLRPKILLAGHGRPLLDNVADRLEAWAEQIY